MSIRRAFSVLVAAAVLSLSPVNEVANAQEQGKEAAEGALVGKVTVVDNAAVLLDIDFPGGSVAQYLDLIASVLPEASEGWRKSNNIEYGGDMSIVQHDDCARVRMPAVKLHGAMVSSAVEMLPMLVPGVRVLRDPPPLPPGAVQGVFTKGDKPEAVRRVNPLVYVVSIVANEVSPGDFLRSEETTLDVDFPGGTFPQYVDYLRKAAPRMNIVFFGDVPTELVPPIKMTDVPFLDAARVLHSIVQGGSSAAEVQTQGEVITVRGIKSGDTRVVTVVENVGEQIAGGVKQDDLLSAVQAVVEVVGGKVEARFHEPTTLLILRGALDDVSAVQAAVSKIRKR